MSLISNLFRGSSQPTAERRVALDDAAAEAVRAVAESILAGTWAKLSRAADAAATAGMPAAEDALMDALVRYALSARDAPSAGELRGRTDEVRERIRAIDAPGMTALDEMATLLPVVVEQTLLRAALEACGEQVELKIGRRGRLELEVRAVEPWVALGLLEPDAVGRAAHWAEADPPLRMEMEAAFWWVTRWSAPGEGDLERFRRMHVRAQEWMLADRAAVTLREPVLARLLRERAHDGWPARQREVLERLPGSILGVFTARGLDGAGGGVAVSAEDGREMELLYDPESRVEEGDLLIGRFLPFDGGRWFCSFGVEAASPRDVDADRLLRAWGELRAELPDAVALEGAITRHVHGRTAPRSVPPAEDPDDAIRRLRALREALAERVVDDEGAAPDVPAGEEAIATLRSGDAALGAWAEALTELARKRVPGRRLDQLRRKRKAKKGKRR